jgi:tetratricopeptide (TPR) repeat protein
LLVENADMTEQDNDLDQAKTLYKKAQVAFDSGAYRDCIAGLEQALALVSRNTPLGGQMQLWLVNAYAAADRMDEAIALCERLLTHPDWQIRQQSKRIVYILKAPKLKAKEEWLTKIPELNHLEASEKTQFATTRKSSAKEPDPPPFLGLGEGAPLNLSQGTGNEDRFIWVALGGAVLILGGLWWWS